MATWIATLLRSVVLFIIILAAVQIGLRKLNAFPLLQTVTLFSLGLTAVVLSLGLVSVVDAAIVLAVWIILPIAVYYLAIKFNAFGRLIFGTEIPLVSQGKILEDQLPKVGLTAAELLSRLRHKDVFSINDVEFAAMEPDGKLSVMLKKERQPVTPKTLNLPTARETPPQIVILDGTIKDDGLTNLGLNRRWLTAELEKTGAALENVFIGQVDAAGCLYLDLFDDSPTVSTPKTKELALTTLKQCQANSESYAAQTDNQEAKAMYSECAQILTAVIAELEPWLNQ